MKPAVKIGIAVAALLAAGVVTWAFSGQKDQQVMSTDDSKTLYLCMGCNEASEVTAKEFQDLAKQSGGFGAPYVCPKCKKKELYRGTKCEKCGTIFAKDAPESSGVCPKCSPGAVRPPPEPDVEEAAPTTPEDDGSGTAAPDTPKPKRKKMAAG